MYFTPNLILYFTHILFRKIDSEMVNELGCQLRLLDEPEDELSPLERHNAKQEATFIKEIIRSVKIRNVHRPQQSDPSLVQKLSSAEFEIPILQGPYLLQPAPEEIYDEEVFASDIARIGTSRFAILAIAYSSGRVDMLLEYESIGPRWFSKTVSFSPVFGFGRKVKPS